MNGGSPLPPRPPLGPEAAAELTRSILARTSGSPCQRLEALACAFVDGELDAPKSAVVQSHLDYCPACSALVAALRVSTGVLATFSGADPGPWFSQRVLVATVHQRRVPDGIDRRGLWARLLHRPRICLEAAWLGAAAGLMGLYLPLPAMPGGRPVPAIRWVQPLKASTGRVAGELALAGRRTQVSLRTALVPSVPRLENLGRTWYARGREGLAKGLGYVRSRRGTGAETTGAPNS